MKILDVYFHNTFTGRLIQETSGQLTFTYAPSYINNKDSQAISVSLPLKEQSYQDDLTRPFFSGLLPDDLVRHRLAKYLGVSEKNPFSLLKAVGGECAGALTLLSEGMELPQPASRDLEELDDHKLNELLTILKQRRSEISSSGYVVASLEAALWCIANTENFQDAVLLAANLGDDADTVAAITGQIAGAIYGFSNIPETWVNKLAWKDELIEGTNNLLESQLISPPPTS